MTYAIRDQHRVDDGVENGRDVLTGAFTGDLTRRCGCGDWGHSDSSWCVSCIQCVDCCECGDLFTPAGDTNGLVLVVSGTGRDSAARRFVDNTPQAREVWTFTTATDLGSHTNAIHTPAETFEDLSERHSMVVWEGTHGGRWGVIAADVADQIRLGRIAVVAAGKQGTRALQNRFEGTVAVQLRDPAEQRPCDTNVDGLHDATMVNDGTGSLVVSLQRLVSEKRRFVSSHANQCFYTTPMVLEMAGCTSRQMNYWLAQGYLPEPVVPAAGSGRNRLWTAGEAHRLMQLAGLVNAGVAVPTAAAVVNEHNGGMHTPALSIEIRVSPPEPRPAVAAIGLRPEHSEARDRLLADLVVYWNETRPEPPSIRDLYYIYIDVPAVGNETPVRVYQFTRWVRSSPAVKLVGSKGNWVVALTKMDHGPEKPRN